MLKLWHRTVVLSGLVLLLISAGSAQAQQAAKPASAYPARPIRFVIGFPPGGGSDAVARIVAPRLGDSLGQQVVVDNRGGAATIIGMDIVAKSAPDGYTMGLATSNLAVNPALYPKLPYGIVMAAHTDKNHIDRLDKELRAIVAQPDVKERFGRIGVESIGDGPREFGAFVRVEAARWEKIIRSAGLRAE